MSHPLDKGLQNGLAVYYLLVALLNLGFAAYYQWYCEPRKKNIAAIWAGVAALFVLHAIAYALGAGWVLPLGIRETVDHFTGPVSYTMLSIVAFTAMLYWRKYVVNPQFAWAILNVSL